MNKCVHFNGIQHGRCRAGVAYSDARDQNGLLPCRPDAAIRVGAKPCESFQEMSQQQVDELRAKIEARFAELRERGRRGECGACGARIERAQQVGRCVYAQPCGHRIGQGDAADVNKALEALRAGA